jgi:hypothetical protein
MNQQTSEVSLVRIPTASKLKQFSLCPRSVIDVDSPVNAERQPSAPGSAAAVGQFLHSALESFLHARINEKLDFDASFDIAANKARRLGVFLEFCQLDKSVIDSFTPGAVLVHTEIPMIMPRSGKSRVSKYAFATENDVLAGTADFIIEYNDGMFVIGDWKTGKDDVDDPHENFQLQALASMSFDCFKISGFSLAIANPTLGKVAMSPPYNEPDFDKSLVMNELDITERAGNHCKYCPLKESCSSFSNMIDQDLKTMEVLSVNSEAI